MRAWWIALVTAAAALAACSSDPDSGAAEDEGGGASGAGDVGGSEGYSDGYGGDGPATCDAPMDRCPTDMPFTGGPCEPGLSCDYPDPDGISWSFTCPSGTWSGSGSCDEELLGCAATPPAAESCPSPFSGEMSAGLQVGPADPTAAFRPFEQGETPNIEWGGQGSAMIFYRIQLDGEDLPDCVQIDSTLTPVGLYEESLVSNVKLRCGESLRLYIIVPFGTCEETEPIDSVLRVAIDGIGETEVTLSVPPDAFCGGFG